MEDLVTQQCVIISPVENQPLNFMTGRMIVINTLLPTIRKEIKFLKVVMAIVMEVGHYTSTIIQTGPSVLQEVHFSLMEVFNITM